MAFRFSIVLSLAGFLGACEARHQPGFLYVNAVDQGHFEIYRIASEEPVQFVSEQIGTFKELTPLTPGSYLVMADCSSEIVIIKPGQTVYMMAHAIRFIPPSPPDQHDRFSIQCSRFEQTRLRQHLVNQYTVNVLATQSELLIGMVPLRLPIDHLKKAGSPQLLEYPLASVTVADESEVANTVSLPYFVSSEDSLIAVTESQQFGNRVFLVSGTYTVEVNGTKMRVNLAANQEKVIRPAYLRVSTSNDTPLELSSKIRGAPLFVELNRGHWINLNETYPVLPGEAQLKLDGSDITVPQKLNEGELHNLHVRSVTANLDCSPWEWTCLGSRKILLYYGDQLYPFATGVTDVPLLFIGEDVWLSIEGSRDIRFHLDDQRRDATLYVGHVRLVPKHTVRSNQVTDLVRMETLGSPTTGHTLDVNLEEETVMPLIAGRYMLASYVTTNDSELQRAATRQAVTVVPGRLTEVSVPVLVSESRMVALTATDERRVQRDQRQRQLKWARPYVPAEPVTIH